MKTKRNKTPLYITVGIIILIFSYIGYDLFIFSPKYEKKVANIEKQFNELKIYLDKKLPEIDSAINITSKQYSELKISKDKFNRINHK